jgi:hypothetical protein
MNLYDYNHPVICCEIKLSLFYMVCSYLADVITSIFLCFAAEYISDMLHHCITFCSMCTLLQRISLIDAEKRSLAKALEDAANQFFHLGF